MPKISYIEKRFQAKSQAVIENAQSIIGEYQEQGFDLTLRQLFYQFVSRDLIENTNRSYKRLGSIISDARNAGLIDWNAIEDRTRNLMGLNHWSDPSQIVRSCSYSYREDKWSEQEVRLEVWIEKDALLGVIEGVCGELDIDYFSCRGYTSQSEVWNAARRIMSYNEQGQRVVILHLGDHDPSGIDMTRDIEARLHLYGADVEIRRIALTMAQIEEYQPPPNPAKLTDSRAADYCAQYGADSWELDALEPTVMADLIRTQTLAERDEEIWNWTVTREDNRKQIIIDLADRWDEVVEWLEN